MSSGGSKHGQTRGPVLSPALDHFAGGNFWESALSQAGAILGGALVDALAQKRDFLKVCDCLSDVFRVKFRSTVLFIQCCQKSLTRFKEGSVANSKGGGTHGSVRGGMSCGDAVDLVDEPDLRDNIALR